MSLYYFLILYILVCGILLGTGKQHTKKNFILLSLTFGVFYLFIALRGKQIGNDTNVYVDLYETIIYSEVSELSWRYEIGYLYLNKFLSYFTSNPQIILIISSLIIVLGFSRFIYKYSSMPWLSTFLFFTLGYFGTSMNTIRLNIAIVIILFSFDFLIKGKVWKFFLSVIIAYFFHKTAIVFLVALPLKYMKINFKTILSLTGLSFVLYLFFPLMLSYALEVFPVYQYYLGSEYLNGSIRLASVMNMLVGVCVVVFGILILKPSHTLIHNNFVHSERMKIVNENMLRIILVSVLITFISFNFSLLDRVAEYFFVFSVVFLPNVIAAIKDRYLVAFSSVITIILFWAYQTSILIYRPEWNKIYPYEFFW